MSKQIKIWDYLHQKGVLENGSEKEIEQAKKEFRKKYLVEYKRNYRLKNKEFVINLDRGTGEFSRVKQAAKLHHKTIPAFIKSATFGYIERKYVVPNAYQIAQLEQLLAQVLNEIQQLTRRKERYFWEKNAALESIEKRIESLETEINQIFRHPPEYK